MDQQKDLAQVSCDSFVKTVGGDLVSNEEWKIKDNSGLIAKINIPASDVKIEYRVFVKDFIQYQLVVLAANSNFDEKAAANFFKSFKLNT